MESGEVYFQNQSFEWKQVEERLAHHFAIESVSDSEVPVKYYDSFDWRLYRLGWTLLQQKEKFHLLSLRDGSQIHSLSLPSQGDVRFWWDFPAGSLKEVLKSALEVRTLLPMLTVTTANENHILRNADQKIVVRIQVELIYLQTNSHEPVPVHVIKQQPVKGYPSEFNVAKSYLAQFASPQNSFGEIYELLLKTAGKQPGAYSSKMPEKLTPDMTADQAMRKILDFLLGVIRQNHEGICSDRDTEFLHDFRVAVRRTRAVLTQIKGVFPEEKIAPFKQAFVKLGKQTNRLRDLDVYLLKKQTYHEMLPEYLQPGLLPLFKQLEQERDREFHAVVRVLTANSFHQLLDNWEGFLNPSDPQKRGNAPLAAIPVRKLAQQLIRKRFRKVVKLSQHIHADTPDAEIHRLRIHCKKLRYLLEFFASLFPAEEIKRLIKDLKTLQGRLGDFNDLSVQQQQLQNYLNLTTGEATDSGLFHSAVGALIGVLHQKQHEMRSELQQLFDDFSQPEILKIQKKHFK